MKQKCIAAAVIFMVFCTLFSCTNKESNEKKNLVMVFLPNESNESMKDARLAFKEILEEATGLTVEIKTTTDYNIALEAIISGQADMAYIGAEGYINAHKRNPKIIPLATNSGPSGTLEDAKYYSLIAVRKEDENIYKTETGYDLEKLQGKIISFVTPSSTSGFTIPASVIASRFGISDLDEIIQSKKVFSDVIFAGTHQAAQINLFDEFAGTEMTVIQSIPVLNAPIVVNSENISKEYQKKIQEALTSEKTANTPGIFKIEGSDKKGMYLKYTENTRLVKTDDAWYDEVRNLTK